MSVNKVILIGHLGKDPEIRTGDGWKYASFSLATTHPGFKTKEGIEVAPVTQWHNIVAKNGLATIIERYVHKGDPIYIEGEITYRSYEKEGVARYSTEIIVAEINLLSTKKTEGTPPPPQYPPPSVGFAPAVTQSATYPPIQPVNDLPF